MSGSSPVGSSINLNLPQLPDLANISSDPNKIAYNLIQLYNAVGILASAIDAYTGNTPNPDPTQFLASGSGLNQAQVGNICTIYGIAKVNLTYGQIVALDPSTGQFIPATGIAAALGLGVVNFPGGATAGSNVSVQFFGVAGFYAAGSFAPGTEYYVGAAGSFTTVRPTVGTTGQSIGVGLTTQAIWIKPSGLLKF